MTSLITCEETQERKIQIMLTFYEQGFLKYGSRGRPTKTKLLKRYTSLFEPKVQLTDISSLLQDTATGDILNYSDLPSKHSDIRDQSKCVFFSDFSLNNSELYTHEGIEDQKQLSDTDSISNCLFGSSDVISEVDEIDLNIDSSFNSSTCNREHWTAETYQGSTDTGDTTYHNKSEKVCYMEQLGLKPSVSPQIHCPKECENIFDSFQKFLETDGQSNNMNSSHQYSLTATSGTMDFGCASKLNTVKCKPTVNNVRKGIARYKNQTKTNRSKLAFSQGCLKKNLKMFARDLQIYAHQRKSSKVKVHIQGKQVNCRRENKTAVLSDLTLKDKMQEQDEKLKQVITKLKGKHSDTLVTDEKKFKTKPVVSSFANRANARSQSDYEDNLDPVAPTVKGENKSVGECSKSKQLSNVQSANMKAEHCSNKTVNIELTATQNGSCTRPCTINSTDNVVSPARENKNSASCERKQYFMRQRRLLKFPSTVPSSVLKFIRTRKTQCGISLKRSSLNHVGSKKIKRGTDASVRVPVKSFAGSLSQKKNDLKKLKQKENAESGAPNTKPTSEDGNVHHPLDTRKRKLSSNSNSTEKLSTKRRTVSVSATKCKPEHNPERFLQEFSRHNWLINKYQLQTTDLMEEAEAKITSKEKTSNQILSRIEGKKGFRAGALETEADSLIKDCSETVEIRQPETTTSNHNTGCYSDAQTSCQVNKTPPLLIPANKAPVTRQHELKQTSILNCHSNIDQLPKIPPLKPDLPDNGTELKSSCANILKSTEDSSLTRERFRQNSEYTKIPYVDNSKERFSTTPTKVSSIVTSLDTSLASKGTAAVSYVETSPPCPNPDNVIVIVPSDEEHYTQVPTPLASSPNECDPKIKPGLIPLHQSFKTNANSIDAIPSQCNLSLTEVPPGEKAVQIVDQGKPVQIVNTSFLPGSVLVVCNAPCSTPSAVLGGPNVCPTVSSSPVLATQTIVSHANYPGSKVETLPPKLHTSKINSFENVNHYISGDTDSLEITQPHGVHVPMQKTEIQCEPLKTKHPVHYVDLTKDSPSESTANGCKEAVHEIKVRISSQNSQTSDRTTQMGVITNRMSEISHNNDRPDLQKLKNEYLKFSKIFKRLTDIEEIKEKERQILQEKKVQATMLMKTIKKQYENIKQINLPQKEKSVSETELEHSNNETSDNSLSSVQAHSKPNRVKLLIDCDPPPAHKNSSQCIDYVSASNVECNFVKGYPLSTARPSIDKNTSIHSPHLKQEKDVNNDKDCAVDLSRKKRETLCNLISESHTNRTLVDSENHVDLTSEKDTFDMGNSPATNEGTKANSMESEDKLNTCIFTTRSENTDPIKIQSNMPMKSSVQNQTIAKKLPLVQTSSQTPPQVSYQTPQRPHQYPWTSTHVPQQHIQPQVRTQVQQPRFTQSVRNQEAALRPALPQRFTPYRLGNLVHTPPLQNPFTPTNRTLSDIPQRVVTYRNSFRAPAMGQDTLGAEFHQKQNILGKSHSNYNMTTTKPGQVHRPLIQRQAIPQTSPQRPIPIHRSMPVMPSNTQDQNGPSAFVPLKTRNPMTVQNGIRNCAPHLPIAINPTSQMISGTTPGFSQRAPLHPKPQMPKPVSQSISPMVSSPNNKSSEDARVQSMWVQFNMGLLKCGICQKKAMFVCSRCKGMPYCSEYCQTESWSQHAPICGLSKKST